MTAEVMRQAGIEFARLKATFDLDDLRHNDSLICKQGSFRECVVLKLQKASWTTDSMEQLENESGIFFSIWVDDKAATEGRAHYNIHALKLRHLHGHSIQSREFAAAFRKGFAAVQREWPNVSVDYGPLTLMQGWIELVPARFARDGSQLMNQFVELSPWIDRLLAERRKT
jgi:hypothetical protein